MEKVSKNRVKVSKDKVVREQAPAAQNVSPISGRPYTPEQLGWGTGYEPNLQAQDVGLEIAKAIDVEEAYNTTMSPEDKQRLLSLVNKQPAEREREGNYLLGKYNPGGGDFATPGRFTTAQNTAAVEQDFLKRAEALGFSRENLPKDPGVVQTILDSLGQAVTVGAADYLGAQQVPSLQALRETKQRGEEDTGFLANFKRALSQPAGAFGIGAETPSLNASTLDLLQNYNPELLKRVVENDPNLSEDEYRQGVQNAFNTRSRAGALRSPGASLFGEGLGVATGEGLAAKALGKTFTRPVVQAGKEAFRGYASGETPAQSTGGALLGAAGGFAGGKLGEKGGKAIGGPQLKGAKDVLAARAAQNKIDDMLAPLVGMSKEEFVAGQTKAQRELLAKAIKELRAEKKAQASSFAKFVEAENAHKVDMLAFEQKVQKAADDYARGKLGFKDYEKILAKEREAAFQQAKNFSEGKAPKLISEVEKTQLKANEAAAKVEKVMRSEAGLVGNISRQQLEAVDRARPQLMKQVEEQVLTPDEQLTLMDLDLRRGEIGREALAMKPKEQAKKLYEPLLENAKAEAEFYKQKVEEAVQKAATPPTVPEVDVDLFNKLYGERVENRMKAGFVPRSPEVLSEEAKRAMSFAPGGEGPVLFEKAGLTPEATRLSQLYSALQEKRVAPPVPMSRQEMIGAAQQKLQQPAYREALLAESPKQRAVLEAPFVPPTEEELVKQLSKGVTAPQAEKAYGRAGMKVPFAPAYVSVGEAKPALSSVEISPYAKYAKEAVKRDVAQEAMQTPVAVPALQAALTTTARDLSKPLTGRQSDIATLVSWLAPQSEEEQQTPPMTQTLEEDFKRKLKEYLK